MAADIITFDPFSARFSLDRQLLASDVADYVAGNGQREADYEKEKNTGFEPVQKRIRDEC